MLPKCFCQDACLLLQFVEIKNGPRPRRPRLGEPAIFEAYYLSSPDEWGRRTPSPPGSPTTARAPRIPIRIAPWITGYSEVMPGWREGISIRFCPIGVRHCPKTRFATSFSAIGTMSLGPNRTQLPILKLGRRPNFAKLEDCGARDREYFNEFNG
jgi:hypothetical protein